MMIVLGCKDSSSRKFTNSRIICIQEIEEYVLCVTQFAAGPFRAGPFIEFEATEVLVGCL
jgi:hypothetical protein